ncbi:MAG: hypothetical protein JXA46_05250 [Dehalococcoidales bacterium]|nr:hypothetical protein [Dehalococcoidales bacterium]
MLSGNTGIKILLTGVIGIFIGVLGTLGVQWYNANAGQYHGIEPSILEGYSTGTNYDGTAIGISDEPGEGGDGYRIGGAFWREFGGPWHDRGSAPSLEWPSYGQKIRLGIIDYKPTDQAPGSSAVVWYEVIDVKNKVTP